jgi:hypothetical protein
MTLKFLKTLCLRRWAHWLVDSIISQQSLRLEASFKVERDLKPSPPSSIGLHTLKQDTFTSFLIFLYLDNFYFYWKEFIFKTFMIWLRIEKDKKLLSLNMLTFFFACIELFFLAFKSYSLWYFFKAFWFKCLSLLNIKILSFYLLNSF